MEDGSSSVEGESNADDPELVHPEMAVTVTARTAIHFIALVLNMIIPLLILYCQHRI